MQWEEGEGRESVLHLLRNAAVEELVAVAGDRTARTARSNPVEGSAGVAEVGRLARGSSPRGAGELEGTEAARTVKVHSRVLGSRHSPVVRSISLLYPSVVNSIADLHRTAVVYENLGVDQLAMVRLLLEHHLGLRRGNQGRCTLLVGHIHL